MINCVRGITRHAAISPPILRAFIHTSRNSEFGFNQLRYAYTHGLDNSTDIDPTTTTAIYGRKNRL